VDEIFFNKRPDLHQAYNLRLPLPPARGRSGESEDINTYAFYSIRIALAVGRSDNGSDVINYVSHRDMKMPYCSEWNEKAIGVRTQLDSFKEKKHGVGRKFHR
jgi:hypothetical protein